MTKDEKVAFVSELAQKFREKPNFYILDIGGFSVEKTFAFRTKCYKENLELKTAKNTLIIKALQAVDSEAYKELFPHIKQSSSILFLADNPNTPAKMIKEFREKDEKPSLKLAYVESSTFIGDSSLELLENLKSKKQLIGEIVGMLQSPAQKVIGALQSPAQKIAGILETLANK